MLYSALILLIVLTWTGIAEGRTNDTGTKIASLKSFRAFFKSLSFRVLSSADFEHHQIKYYCMKCGNEHRDIACPKCGSKIKRAE
jgi:rubrerythrin